MISKIVALYNLCFRGRIFVNSRRCCKREIYETKSFLGQDFFYEDMESLTQMLRALATDGNKHRAKVDKRKQRSVFRDVLRAVEVGFYGARTVSSSL